MSDIAAFEGRVASPPTKARSALSGGFLIAVTLLLVCGTALLALFASMTTAPVTLTLLCVFGTLGVFFVFGVVAGHIRLSERTTELDLIWAAFERIDEGLVMTDRDGLILASNRAAQDIIGGDRLAPQTFLESAFHDQPGLNRALFQLNRAIKQGLARSEDVYIDPGRDAGAPLCAGRWVRITAKPMTTDALPNTDGPVTAWTLIDITRDRGAARAEAAKLEAELTSYEQMPAGYMVVDPRGELEYVNDRLAHWLGYSEPGARHALRLERMMSRDSVELIKAMAQGSWGAPRTIEIDLTTDDGYAWPATVIIEHTDGLGRTPNAEAAPRAIASLDPAKTSDCAFRAVVLPRNETVDGPEAAPADGVGRRDGLARLLRSAPFGIATVTSDGVVEETNAAFTRLMLNTSQNRTQRAIDVLAAHADTETRQEIASALDAVLAGKANLPPIEIGVGEGGAQTRRLFFGSIGPAGAKPSLGVVYVIDASEEKALEQKFAQSQKMEVVGKLAGGVAHDFNNVMTAIIGFSDLLLGTHRPGDPSYQHLKNIRSSAVRAADLVRNLLAFSRQQQLRPQVLNAQEVVTEISTMLNRTLGEKIELKIHSERDLWLVKADRNELERVIVNLAVNARDAMPDGGRLSIRTRNVTERESARLSENGLTVGEYVLIEIEDTGVGMTADVLEKIFEPFFTTKDIGRGTGLGLSTVYGIVKQTGGFIYPTSTPGEGTSFRVYLPRHAVDDAELVDAEAAGGAGAEPAKPHRDLTGSGRVLLVEDEDAVRLFATQALTRLGYEVFQAGDGYEALDLFEEDGLEVDLVVSDVKMPEMDGPTLLKELRKSQPDLRFVFVSGYPADAFSKTLAAEDNYTFLPKPYSLEQIAEIVKEQIAA